MFEIKQYNVYSGGLVYSKARQVQSLATSARKIKEITTTSQFKEELVSAKDKLVVVLFYMEECKPCHIVKAEMEKMMNLPEFAAVVFLKVNKKDEAAKHCHIGGTPTIIFNTDGKQVDEIEGAFLDVITETIISIKELRFLRLFKICFLFFFFFFVI